MFNLRNNINNDNNNNDIVNDNIDNNVNNDINDINDINSDITNQIDNVINNASSDNNKLSNKKTYTDEEKKQIINNTIVIHKDKWQNLESGIFVSYDKIDNTFVKGGYIHMVNKSNDGKLYFRIIFSQLNPDKGYILYFDQIKTLYKKIDQTSYYELNAIRDSYENIFKSMKEHTQNQDIKIAYLKKELEKKIDDQSVIFNNKCAKILGKIKELHNI